MSEKLIYTANGQLNDHFVVDIYSADEFETFINDNIAFVGRIVMATVERV